MNRIKVFNLKKLLGKVGIRGPLGTSAAAALAFFKEENGQNLEVENITVNNKQNVIGELDVSGLAYFKNIGSNTILLSNDTGSNYLFKLSPGNALYFKSSSIPLSAIFAKSASGTSALEYVLGI